MPIKKKKKKKVLRADLNKKQRRGMSNEQRQILPKSRVTIHIVLVLDVFYA